MLFYSQPSLPHITVPPSPHLLPVTQTWTLQKAPLVPSAIMDPFTQQGCSGRRRRSSRRTAMMFINRIRLHQIVIPTATTTVTIRLPTATEVMQQGPNTGGVAAATVRAAAARRSVKPLRSSCSGNGNFSREKAHKRLAQQKKSSSHILSVFGWGWVCELETLCTTCRLTSSILGSLRNGSPFVQL